MRSPIRLARPCCAAAATLALLASATAPTDAQTLGTDGRPVTNAAGATFGVMAHRGGAGEAPQNSLEAFTNAVAAGYDGIETDLRFTSDGVGILSHDATLPSRCTSAGKQLHKLTAKQVAAVRCADASGAKVVPIPTFAQLAGVLKGHPEVVLTLDLKNHPGQSARSMRGYAAKAMKLLKQYGLTAQTRILTYRWQQMLSTIRSYSSSIYVMAYDNSTLSLGRVREAAKLRASSYGIRMADTSAFLARYVAAKGLDFLPWQVVGDEQQAFAISYGPRKQYFMTDLPGVLQAALVAGAVDLDPVPRAETTTLAAPVRIGSGTWRANTRHYPAVLGKAVPTAERSQLDTVALSITVTAAGSGSVTVGPMNGGSTSSVKFAKGTSTLSLAVPLGDAGKVRIVTSRTAKVTVSVVGYTRIRF